MAYSSGSSGIDTVLLPGGLVELSDRRTESRWTVEVRALRMATDSITRGQYADVMHARPGTAPIDNLRTGQAPGVSSALADDADFPVDSVSWWDAVRFCNAASLADGLTPAYALAASDSLDSPETKRYASSAEARASLTPPPTGAYSSTAAPLITWNPAADGYRLPTESEWEYACRAGTLGARYGNIDDIAWYRGNSGGYVHPVGTRAPNAHGLHDMLGNVWNWCWDHYDPDVYGNYRVLRGGGWLDEHWSCRASVRRRSHPAFLSDDVGFRVARRADARSTRHPS